MTDNYSDVPIKDIKRQGRDCVDTFLLTVFKFRPGLKRPKPKIPRDWKNSSPIEKIRNNLSTFYIMNGPKTNMSTTFMVGRDELTVKHTLQEDVCSIQEEAGTKIILRCFYTSHMKMMTKRRKWNCKAWRKLHRTGTHREHGK